MSMRDIKNHDRKYVFFSNTPLCLTIVCIKYPIAQTQFTRENMQVVSDDVSGLVEDLGGGGNHLGGGGGGGGANPDQALGISFEPALSP